MHGRHIRAQNRDGSFPKQHIIPKAGMSRTKGLPDVALIKDPLIAKTLPNPIVMIGKLSSPKKDSVTVLGKDKPDPKIVLSMKTPPQLIPERWNKIRETTKPKTPFNNKEASLTPLNPMGIVSCSNGAPKEMSHVLL